MEKETIMSTSFDSIKRGLLDAIEHAKGQSPQTRIHRPRLVQLWKRKPS
jgi:putative transcriptional regulator